MRFQTLFPLLALTLLASIVRAVSPAPRPNIVVILADDLGARDLGCYGADLISSPHIDQLARDGILFTTAYAPAPVCSPTRAALLTGKHPARLGITTWSEASAKGPTDRRLLQAASRHDLPLSEITLARRLQLAGYLTAAIGKWHLGDASHFPEAHGFDLAIGATHWGAPPSYFHPFRSTNTTASERRFVPGLGFGKPGDYLTDRLTDESLHVIETAARRHQPFFLWLAHHAPHTPIEARPSNIARFDARLKPGMNHRNPAYAAMIAHLDDSVGRVRSRLRSLGLERNTLVVFASDNGGYIGNDSRRDIPVTSNAPLRSGKGSLYEGGLRVPLLIHWPGRIHAASRCDEPVQLTDLFPTLLAAAGLPVTDDDTRDALDLTPLLRNPAASLPRDTLFFHFPHYYHAPPTTPCGALRTRRWKLIEHFEDHRCELFDLAADPGETRDRSAGEPGITAELQERLATWRHHVGARMPSPNPQAPRPTH